MTDPNDPIPPDRQVIVREPTVEADLVQPEVLLQPLGVHADFHSFTTMTCLAAHPLEWSEAPAPPRVDLEELLRARQEQLSGPPKDWIARVMDSRLVRWLRRWGLIR